MKYTVNKPSVWLYKTEDLTAEVSDELLFGTVIDVITEYDTTAYVRTDYGYCGYLSRWEINECSDGDCESSVRKILQHGCDVLTMPDFCKRPYMSLSRGSRIIVGESGCGKDGRFTQCLIGTRVFYLPTYAIEEKKYDSLSEAISENAKRYVGTTYRWGGKSQWGTDCSGLAFMSCFLCNRVIYRDSVPDDRYVYEISPEEVRTGDLAYFKGHVAVMTGYDSYVHASYSRCVVEENNFSEGRLDRKDVVMFARIKENGQHTL